MIISEDTLDFGKMHFPLKIFLKMLLQLYTYQILQNTVSFAHILVFSTLNEHCVIWKDDLMPSSFGDSLSWVIFPESIIIGDVIITAIEIKLSPRRSYTFKMESEPPYLQQNLCQKLSQGPKLECQRNLAVKNKGNT